jgi:putative membrane protein
MYLYVKAFHIIFVVTWFSGMFYIVRLFIYNREALDKPTQEKEILQKQFRIMMMRLWYYITWPSAVLTLIFGSSMAVLYGDISGWLSTKLLFVFGLYLYHLSLHVIYKQQINGNFNLTSKQLRIWNEVATIFLISIVIIAVIK